MAWKEMLTNPNTRASRRFELGVQVLIVLSLLGFSIDTWPGLKAEARAGLMLFEVVAIALFSFEYALRLWAAPRKREYALSFFGLVDFFAVAPFYFAFFSPEPFAEFMNNAVALRAFRFLRVLKLFRRSAAFHRFERAFTIIRGELEVFAGVVCLLFYLAAVGIYLFEHEAQPAAFGSIFHSLWWALVTLTTVGYGDVYPVTLGGRIFTALVVLIAIGVVAVPSGLFASALTQSREEEKKREHAAREQA